MNGLRIVLIFSFFHDGIFNFNNIIISIAESNLCKLKKSYKKEKSENFTLDSVIRLTIYAIVSIRISCCLLILNICSQMASYLVQWFNRKWHQQRVCLLSFFFFNTNFTDLSKTVQEALVFWEGNLIQNDDCGLSQFMTRRI